MLERFLHHFHGHSHLLPTSCSLLIRAKAHQSVLNPCQIKIQCFWKQVRLTLAGLGKSMILLRLLPGQQGAAVPTPPKPPVRLFGSELTPKKEFLRKTLIQLWQELCLQTVNEWTYQ